MLGSRGGLGRLVLVGLLAALLAVAPGAAPAGESRHAAAHVSVDGIDAIPSGPSVAERLEEIRRRIAESVAYPPLARRRGESGVASVEFRIDRSGVAREVRIARSSGYGLLDRAAEQGVLRARPLPWVHGRLVVPVRFELARRR